MLASIILIISCITAFVSNYVQTDVTEERFGEATRRLLDWSDTCKESDKLTLLLTMGMGISDAVVIMITKDEISPNCNITIFTVQRVYLIIVIEFPDKQRGDMDCHQNSSKVLVYDALNSDNPIEACEKVNENTGDSYGIMHFVTKEPNATIAISSDTEFETIKITATSGRQLEEREECSSDEHACKVMDMNQEQITTCVSVEVVCDGHNNCAKRNSYDEDPRICLVSRFKMLWLVVVATLTMVALCVFFLVRLLCSCMPRIGDSFFIFNEDEDNRLNLATTYALPTDRSQSAIKDHLSVSSRTNSYRYRSHIISGETEGHEDRRVSISASPPRVSPQISVILSQESEVELRTDYPTTSVRKSSLKPIKGTLPSTFPEESSFKTTPQLHKKAVNRLSMSPRRSSQRVQITRLSSPPTMLTPTKDSRNARKPRFQEDTEIIEDTSKNKPVKQKGKIIFDQSQKKKPAPISILNMERETVIDSVVSHQRPRPSQGSSIEMENDKSIISNTRRPSIAEAKSSRTITRKRMSK